MGKTVSELLMELNEMQREVGGNVEVLGPNGGTPSFRFSRPSTDPADDGGEFVMIVED